MLRLQGKPLPEAFQELKPLGGDSQWWAVLRLSTRRGAEDMSQVMTLQLLQTGLCFSKILMRNQKLPRKMEEENCDNTFYLWTSWCCTYDNGIMSWAGDLASACVFFCYFFFSCTTSLFLSSLPKVVSIYFPLSFHPYKCIAFYLCWYVFFSCKCSTPNSIISSVYITSSFTQNAFRLHKHWVGC